VSTDCGDEPCDIYETAVRRSRKDRKCDACRETIRRGDRYDTTRILFEGQWQATNRCARCEAMYRVLSPLMSRDDDQVCDPELNCGHTWEDNFGEQPPVVVQALAFLTPSEAQVLLERWPAPLHHRDYLVHGPLEAPERTIARLLGWNRAEAAE
jgi:hypothetical protein